MRTEINNLIDKSKYKIFKTFLQYHCGLITEEEIKNGIYLAHKEVDDYVKNPMQFPKELSEEAQTILNDLFISKAVGLEDIDLLKKYVHNNTNPLTVKAMENYYCSGRDREKAVELFKQAAEQGDFFANQFIQKK